MRDLNATRERDTHNNFDNWLYMSYSRCGDCVFSVRFVRDCTDVSYVAREGVELTAHKESVVVEEIKEV